MARKWGISYSVLQNTEINFALAPWVQTSISGPINSLFDVWLCILRSSGGWFSLDPQFHEFWMFNCSQNVCLRLLLFLWVKLAHLRNLILKRENQQARDKKPKLSDMIIGVCLLLFFRATELITLHLCRQYSSWLAAQRPCPFMWHWQKPVPNNQKALLGCFLAIKPVSARTRARNYMFDHTEARKRWWLVLFRPVLDSSPCSSSERQECR